MKNRIARLLFELDLDREHLARLLGRTAQTIGNWVNGKSLPNLQNIRDMESVGINGSYLTYRSDAMFLNGASAKTVRSRIMTRIAVEPGVESNSSSTIG